MTRWFSERAADRPLFCVIGSPVAHSLSPRIHSAFAAQTGRELIYERVEVARGDVAGAVEEFRQVGGVGLNVTVPLKEEAWAVAARRMPRAEAAGAANTLWFDAAGAVMADNTDGTGLVRDLVDNHGIALGGQRVLLIGAGGAARGVMPALTSALPAALTITNRTVSRAAAIAADFAGPVPTDVLAWGATPRAPFDLVINATSLSLQGETPQLSSAALHARTVVYDMMYASAPTAFLAWAGRAGAAQAIDGLGMLVEQAAEAFLIWHGVRPATRPVIGELRRAMSAVRAPEGLSPDPASDP